MSHPAPPFDLSKPEGREKFLNNVQEAQDNGFDLLCGCCGVGIYDDSDMHDSGCVRYPEGGYPAPVWKTE